MSTVHKILEGIMDSLLSGNTRAEDLPQTALRQRHRPASGGGAQGGHAAGKQAQDVHLSENASCGQLANLLPVAALDDCDALHDEEHGLSLTTCSHDDLSGLEGLLIKHDRQVENEVLRAARQQRSASQGRDGAGLDPLPPLSLCGNVLGLCLGPSTMQHVYNGRTLSQGCFNHRAVHAEAAHKAVLARFGRCRPVWADFEGADFPEHLARPCGSEARSDGTFGSYHPTHDQKQIVLAERTHVALLQDDGPGRENNHVRRPRQGPKKHRRYC
mmetsp:Transcript_43675/g.78933  ORF Transcript_43675/g.78933 Transcript_43675/m.78933 type:complete len:272 (-) Transcript_43675:3372-4187(-)